MCDPGSGAHHLGVTTLAPALLTARAAAAAGIDTTWLWDQHKVLGRANGLLHDSRKCARAIAGLKQRPMRLADIDPAEVCGCSDATAPVLAWAKVADAVLAHRATLEGPLDPQALHYLTCSLHARIVASRLVQDHQLLNVAHRAVMEGFERLDRYAASGDAAIERERARCVAATVAHPPQSELSSAAR